MEKKIQNYLHLYLGCNVMIESPIIGETGSEGTSLHGPYKLVAVGISEETIMVKLDNYTLQPTDLIKPLLRPLSTITEDEARECGWMGLFTLEHFAETKRYRPDSFPFLLSNCFDLLNLIDSGLAIDKTKGL